MQKRNSTLSFVWYENLSLRLRQQHELRDKVILRDVTAGSLVGRYIWSVVGSNKYVRLSTTPNIVKIQWRSWLRHCGTSSIPDSVIRIFQWHNPSGRTVALGSTQPLPEMSTRGISWGVKAAGAYGWQPYHLHVLIALKSGSVTNCKYTSIALGIQHAMHMRHIVICGPPRSTIFFHIIS
jgi:hypothetical protein